MWWLLTREVLRLCGTISLSESWDVMGDLFFYCEEQRDAAAAKAALEEPTATGGLDRNASVPIQSGLAADGKKVYYKMR